MSRRFGLDSKTDSKDAEMAQGKEKEPYSGTALGHTWKEIERINERTEQLTAINKRLLELNCLILLLHLAVFLLRQ